MNDTFVLRVFSPKDLRKMDVISIDSIFSYLKDNWLVQKRMLERPNDKHRHKQLKRFAKKCMEEITRPMCYGETKDEKG